MKYSIRFYSQWHCGSGLSAGADVDSLVIKDKNGLPYIPGKTLKGLIREAVEDYAALSQALDATTINAAFGLQVNTNTDKDEPTGQAGTAFFTNAELDEKESKAIVSAGAQRYLYNKVTSTAIDKDGVADDHSLRSIETVVPCTLYAEIHGLPKGVETLIQTSLGLIHHIGINRNRGLGRCDFKVAQIQEGGQQ